MVALFAQQSYNIIELPVKNNEWYTPARYVEAAREVMGGIDLDPASCKEANMVVKASKFYTERENGLLQPWYGNVWLNPPYSSPKSTMGMSGGKLKGYTGYFIEKLISSYEYGEVTQAIVCVNADIVRSWFQCLWAYPVCLSQRPIPFIRPTLKAEHHFFGTAFAYLGSNEQRFIDIFSQFGTIAKRVSQPRQTVTPLSLWEVS